jgi:hypothetical protein
MVNDVTAHNRSLSKPHTGYADARGDPETVDAMALRRRSAGCADVSVGNQVGNEEFLTADARDDRILVGVVAENISDCD